MSDTTLDEAKAWLRERLKDGAECPCCNQLAKMYARSLNANMAIFLIDLVRLSPSRWGGWVNYKDCRFRGRDYNYLKHWGLAADQDEAGIEKSHSGFWRPTQQGIDFVMHRATVDSQIYIYDNRRFGQPPTSKPITIQDALGTKFNYTELMAAQIESQGRGQ